MFSNLISNAIKYRSNRKPEVHITATDNGTEWIFNVTDNGIGIDMRYADDRAPRAQRAEEGPMCVTA